MNGVPAGDEAAAGASRDAPQLAAAQLAGHPRSFEWWYFDAASSEGHSLAVIFSRKPMGGLRRASVAIQYTDPSGRRHGRTEFFRLDAFRARESEGGQRLELGKSAIEMERGASGARAYLVDVAAGDLSARLECVPVLPAFELSPGGTYLVHRERTELFNSVSFAAPRMRVKASVSHQGSSTTFEGDGYHDHPWGTEDYSRTTRSWHWGRLYAPDCSILYGAMTPEPRFELLTRPAAAELRFLYLARGNGGGGLHTGVTLETSRSRGIALGLMGAYPLATELRVPALDLAVSVEHRRTLLNLLWYVRSEVEFHAGASRGMGFAEYARPSSLAHSAFAGCMRALALVTRAPVPAP